MKNNNIASIDHISRSEFESQYFSKQMPIVIKSGLNWQALDWTLGYFISSFPHKQVCLQKIQTSNRQEDFESLNIPMKKAVSLIINNTDPATRYYISQIHIETDFPELLQDFSHPPWIAPGTQYEANFWLGQAGNATPLHYDMSHNFLTQIYGRKLVRLFSPLDSNNLYRRNSNEKLIHVSRIQDIDNVDFNEFPKFKEAVPLQYLLHPGETLFIPAGWWHDIRSLDNIISLNFWWKAKARECLLPHVLKPLAYRLLTSGKFTHIHSRYLDLSDFKDDLEIGKFLIELESYWLSIVFMISFLMEKTCSLYSGSNYNLSAFIELMTENFPHEKEFVEFIMSMLDISKKEEDSLLDKDLVVKLCDEIFRFNSTYLQN